jgi:hypothetical protein
VVSVHSSWKFYFPQFIRYWTVRFSSSQVSFATTYNSVHNWGKYPKAHFTLLFRFSLTLIHWHNLGQDCLKICFSPLILFLCLIHTEKIIFLKWKPLLYHKSDYLHFEITTTTFPLLGLLQSPRNHRMIFKLNCVILIINSPGHWSESWRSCQAQVTQTSNPSYLGSWDQDSCFRPIWEKCSGDLLSKPMAECRPVTPLMEVSLK